MKHLLLITLLAAALFQTPTAKAETPDTEKTKLQLTFIGAIKGDCRITQSEIKKTTAEAGHKTVCGVIKNNNDEITLADLTEYANLKQVKVAYAGDNTTSLLTTLAAWRGYLIKDSAGAVNAHNDITKIEPYNFVLVSREGNTATIRITKDSKAAAIFVVEMNAKLKSKDKSQ
ncbi:MAG: hypothetical protein H7235_01225 [Bdellovibrionaceae bacterium]|nr:hypothetical protein [Pseudobdellovibrionaceae bacterium]